MSDLTEEDHVFIDYWLKVEEELLLEAKERQRQLELLHQEAAVASIQPAPVPQQQHFNPVPSSLPTFTGQYAPQGQSTIHYHSPGMPTGGQRAFIIDQMSGQIIHQPTHSVSTPISPYQSSFSNLPMPLYSSPLQNLSNTAFPVVSPYYYNGQYYNYYNDNKVLFR